MEQNIIAQLAFIEQANHWIKASLEGEKQRSAHRNIVDFRRKLKRKRFALEGNPAAALYGESQAGKSYLVGALLSEKGKPFKILDGKGNQYDFKAQINPRGNEMESTSVITRFSSNYKSINPEYPIIARLLSPTDLIIVICEAYFNNLKVNKPLSFDELKDNIYHFEQQYAGKSECQQLITEDDILNIEDYFDSNFSKLAFNNIKDAKYFEKIASFVTKIPPEEWKNVFSIFWNFNQQLTKLFDDLITRFAKLSFSETVYLPIETVLRDRGTLLDVSRLDEIYGPFKGQETNYTPNTALLFITNNGKEETIEFPKPFLCALTAELIFILPECLSKNKPFLNHTDLLDFPGTRRPESTNEDNIQNDSLSVLLRRGKVDYLFNKYSNNERINTLLFCQNHKQSNQSVIPEKLNRWISLMIGKTPSEREHFRSPIAPLFVISTWFNKDLEFDYSSNKKGSVQSFNERWSQRFTKTLEEQIFKVHEYPWLIEWTISKQNFRNIFLLRDFEKSGTNTQNCSNIFGGYLKEAIEIEEIIPDSYPEFRKDLRQSFIEYPFVLRHFENPEESWDRAATLNEDGTGLIIEKLTLAANHINPARIEKMRNELNDISKGIIDELIRYFHSNDKDEELKKAKAIAGDIQFRLNNVFSGDGIRLFGHLMRELMLNESHVFELYKKKIDDIEHRDVVFLNKYSTHKQQVPVHEDDTVEIYFERLCDHYSKQTPEEKEIFRNQLMEEEIDLEELIFGNPDLLKNNAQQLAELLIDYWFSYINMNDKYTIQKVLGGEKASYLQDISDMYQKLFKRINLVEKIAEKIRRYVDGHGKTDLPYEIIADISAEILNKCISSVGFDYFDESEMDDFRMANEKNNLCLVLESPTNGSEKSVEELFNKIEHWNSLIVSDPGMLKTMPNYSSYFAWYNRLKVGFVSVCNIPNYDVGANEKLGAIITDSRKITY